MSPKKIHDVFELLGRRWALAGVRDD